MKRDAPLVNEVLMYAEFHRNSASKENIVNTMCGFYSYDEIKIAKSILYERFGNLNILLNSAERRTTENRSDLMATSCDIIDDLFKLEESDIKVLCCGSNWMRLPKINPEEITNISIADKLAQMEAKFAKYESALTDVKCSNSKMDARIKRIEKTQKPSNNNESYSKIISNNNSTSDTTISKIISNNNSTSDTTSLKNSDSTPVTTNQQKQSVPEPEPEANISTGAWKKVEHRRQRLSRVTDMRSHGNARSGNGFSGVTSGTPERRRRRGGFMGQSTEGGLGAGPLPVRDFFICRVKKDDNADDVRSHLSKHDIVARDIVAKNNPDSLLNSFKVSVDVVDAEKMNNPMMWPVGVCVRRWRQYNN